MAEDPPPGRAREDMAVIVDDGVGAIVAGTSGVTLNHHTFVVLRRLIGYGVADFAHEYDSMLLGHAHLPPSPMRKLYIETK